MIRFLLLLSLAAVIHAADIINPHADVQIILVSPGELGQIIADNGDPSFPRASTKWKPTFYETRDTIWIAKRGEVETARTLLAVLRKRGLLADDGRALAPTEKGLQR